MRTALLTLLVVLLTAGCGGLPHRSGDAKGSPAPATRDAPKRTAAKRNAPKRDAAKRGAAKQDSQPSPSDADADRCVDRVPSNDGRYAVCYTTSPSPVPLNEPFTIDVWIYEQDRPDELAKAVILDVDAGMPEHHHGMNLKPQVVPVGAALRQDILPGHGAIGNGRFEIRGMLFHMPGHWEIHFDVTRGAVTERAQVAIDLD